jgi:hypothetical protein
MTDKPKTLLGALALALPTIEAAKKNAANPHFKSKYADIGAVIDAIRPIADHGLWFRQVSHDSENGVCVETFYIHDSGELSAGRVFVPASKRDAQGFGSAQTYARRYGLQLAFGLSTEDDDGNAASKAPAAKPISDSDWAMLTQLIEATGTDAAKLCKAYNANSLKAMSAEAAADAITKLQARLAKMTEAGNGAAD